MSVRHALLALLAEKPRYGLQLRQEFEARTGEVWPLNVGQVYTTLQRLERDGLVESDDHEEGPQKTYTITAQGSIELDVWLHTPDTGVSPPRDELVIKMLVALRLPGVDVNALLQSHRRQLVERMQWFTRIKADSDHDIGLALLADSELFRLEAVVRWLDTIDARVKQMSTPLPLDSAPVDSSPRQRHRARR
ncbi:MAG: PadR family transcriptional regulator [Ilumatobacteraceae bacterium]